ncbi:MAG TPA: sensor histidine kinase [Mycobacteriales bacterium]|nr:sensor histidine kinase [Mycobacteriales bacterium]
MQEQSRPGAVADALLDALVGSGGRLLGADWTAVAAGPPHRLVVRAATARGPAAGSPLTEAQPGPDGVPVPVRLSGAGPDGLVLSPVAADGTYAVARSADGVRVLLVLAGVDRPDEPLLGHLLEMAAAALAAQRSATSGTIRAGLREREEERRRWARELHDDTLQQLGALQVLLTSALSQTLSQALSPAPPQALSPAPPQECGPLVDAVRLATELIATQIGNLRHLITELRPAALDDLGLSAPLQALARRTEQLSGVRVTVHVSLRYADGEVSTRLVPDVELAVYRVVQEALSNVRRHAGATRATVTVVEDDDSVVAEISDDGRGFDPDRAAGFGLSGMRERAELAHGRLDVLPVSSAGGGTTVRLVVPARHR